MARADRGEEAEDSPEQRQQEAVHLIRLSDPQEGHGRRPEEEGPEQGVHRGVLAHVVGQRATGQGCGDELRGVPEEEEQIVRVELN